MLWNYKARLTIFSNFQEFARPSNRSSTKFIELRIKGTHDRPMWPSLYILRV